MSALARWTVVKIAPRVPGACLQLFEDLVDVRLELVPNDLLPLVGVSELGLVAREQLSLAVFGQHELGADLGALAAWRLA